MPSLIDMRRRIRAVKSTQQITKAMKMVAASKLRRAQERVDRARPFAQQMLRVLNSIAARVDPTAHPLLARRPSAERRAHAAHRHHGRRGLCGSFNTNIDQGGERFLREHRRPAKSPRPGRPQGPRLLPPPRLRRAVRGRQPASARSSSRTRRRSPRARSRSSSAGRVDSVYLVYNEFKSRDAAARGRRAAAAARDARPRTPAAEPRHRLPVRAVAGAHSRRAAAAARREPDLRALLESAAAEHAARMTAMDAATRNAQRHDRRR